MKPKRGKKKPQRKAESVPKPEPPPVEPEPEPEPEVELPDYADDRSTRSESSESLLPPSLSPAESIYSVSSSSSSVSRCPSSVSTSTASLLSIGPPIRRRPFLDFDCLPGPSRLSSVAETATTTTKKASAVPKKKTAKVGNGDKKKSVPIVESDPLPGTSASFKQKETDTSAAGKPLPERASPSKDVHKPLSLDLGNFGVDISSPSDIYVTNKERKLPMPTPLLTIGTSINHASSLPHTTLSLDIGTPASALSCFGMAEKERSPFLPLTSPKNRKAGITAHFMDNDPMVLLNEPGTSRQKLAEFSLSDYPTVASCIKSYKQAETIAAGNMDPLQDELESILSVVTNRHQDILDQSSDLTIPKGSMSSQQRSSFEDSDLDSDGPTSHVVFFKPTLPKAQMALKSIEESLTEAVNEIQEEADAEEAEASGSKTPSRKRKTKGIGTGSKSRKGRKNAAARNINKRSPSTSSDLSSLFPDVPKMFWDLIDTYCRPIGTDDYNKLKELREDHSDLPEELLQMPPLGPHYLGEEGAKKQAERVCTRDPVGPLTERLVATLVEERIAAHNGNDNPGSPSDSPGPSMFGASAGAEGNVINRDGLLRALELEGGANGHSAPLEKRIRDCLLEQGITDDILNNPIEPDDEVAHEIIRAQDYLRKLHSHNTECLDKLMLQAKILMARQQFQDRLDATELQVLAAYQCYANCKNKKKEPSRYQRQVASKACSARRAALVAIHAFDAKYPFAKM